MTLAIAVTFATGLWAARTERDALAVLALLALFWLGVAALVADLLPLM